MIIRSIRLKNIKSYGEGPDGNGVTVNFEPGINRIAGRNGHGKSSLIEALGYALFLTKPLFEENFDAATYLLRSGKKAGEIDVTFEHRGETCRVERGIGSQNKRRAKVVHLSDGSVAAETDEGVADFLCRLFGFADAARLVELFSKLVGVKQGRLTWPFDSKKTGAREHFEPLLEVEIFRQCFDRLKPVVDEFEELQRGQETKLAAVKERIRERQDSPEQIKARQSQVDGLQHQLDTAKAALNAAELKKHEHESREKAALDARQKRDAANHAFAVAAEQRKNAAQRVKESLEAAVVLTMKAVDFEAFNRAETALGGLQERHTEKARLEKECSEASNRRTDFEGKSTAATQQAQTFLEQRQAKAASLNQLEEAASRLKFALADGKPRFDQLAASVAQARADEATVRHWLGSLARRLSANAPRAVEIEGLGKTLADWNPQLLDDAKEAERHAAEKLETLLGQLTAARESHKTLKTQLDEINGGVCPFLKERCRQFDPDKVGADLHDKEAAIQALEKQLPDAREAHRRAKTRLDTLTGQETQLGQIRKNLEKRLGEFLDEHNALLSDAEREAATRLAQFLNGSTPPAKPAPVFREACFRNDHTTWRAGAAQEISATASAFAAGAREWFDGIAPALKSHFHAFDMERDQRLAQERDLVNHERQIKELKVETESLADKAGGKTNEAGQLRARAQAEANIVRDLEEKLKAFATLDQQVREQQRLKTRHAEGHGRYIAARPIAEQLADRQQALDELLKAESGAADQLRLREEALKQAQDAFDPRALDDARQAFQDANTVAATLAANLANAKTELEREQKRLGEYQAALKDEAVLDLEIARLNAAIALSEKARGVLKNAAPYVAQHLCRRIAGRAQKIFNQINHEPMELDWNSERYSLRIHPGDRRFAMLSGGEQTKLALAMTLAMIKEFSGLKFCVFDEPTYGVDADSRQKLADAIVEAHHAAAFDQLLVVSHDDAFDGKIEHVVQLQKKADGTEPQWI